MLREDLPHHAAEVCPKATVGCPYAAAGCAKRRQRDSMHTHIASAKDDHLAMAMRAIEREPAHTTEVLWTIDDAARHIRDKTATVEWSPRSVIGPNGYKVKLEAKFGKTNADGKPFLGLYMGTVPGPNDRALEWPFPRAATMTLLVPADGPRSAPTEWSSRITNHHASSHFEQGTTRTRGPPNFVPLDVLTAGRFIGPDGELQVRVRFSKLPQELTSMTELRWTIGAVGDRFKVGHLGDLTWYPDCTIGHSGYQVQAVARFRNDCVGLYVGTVPGPFDDELE